MPRTAVLLVISLAACAHARPPAADPTALGADPGAMAVADSWLQRDVCCSPSATASRALLPFMSGAESDEAELRTRFTELTDQRDDQRLASLSGPFTPSTENIGAATPVRRAPAVTDAYGCAPCSW